MDRIEGEQGSIILEVLVSSILLVIAAVGVFGAFDAGARSTAEERHRAQGEGLAQADLARLRTMRISALSNLHQTKVVTIEKTPYTIESDAEYETDKTGTATCQKGTASADYIQIRSTITWPSLGSRDPVIDQSLVAPPNGSVSAESGSLAIEVVNAKNAGIEGIALSGTGAGTFSGDTGPNGCAIFGDLPHGSYTLNVSAPTLVDRDGKPPQAQSTSVVAESTNTLALQYDEPGKVVAKFTTWTPPPAGKLVPSSADAIVAFNSGMKVARAFGTPGTRKEEVTATPLFPFASPSTYSVYAGTCTGNDPNLSGKPTSPEAIAEPLVSPGGSTPVTIEIPALYLTALSGSKASSPGTAVEGATVTVSDAKCTPATPLVRTFTTNKAGGLTDPGLPFSTYNFCVSNGSKRVRVPSLAVPTNPENLAAGTSLTAYLGSSSAETGLCP